MRVLLVTTSTLVMTLVIHTAVTLVALAGSTIPQPPPNPVLRQPRLHHISRYSCIA